MSIFQKINITKPRRNVFDLSHERKLSAKMGYLYPIFLSEVVPSDEFRVNSEIMLRMAPMLAPIMHRVHVYTHYFFVPNRIIWDEWEDFITGGKDGTSAPVRPYMNMQESQKDWFEKGKLNDYFGLPIWTPVVAQPATNLAQISVLPHRAYTLIWNEFFRDQNLQDEIEFSKASGAMTSTEIDKVNPLRKRCWEKDYLTSSLPFAQRGAAVQMPFEPVYKDYTTVVKGVDGTPPPSSASIGTLNAAGETTIIDTALNALQIQNLESGAGVTINDLRTASRLQEWLEKNARGGARYIEQILSHFGVISDDARLQRPEYLGGGRQNVTISEVLNTTGDTGAASPVPQGNMSGHGVSVGRTNRFKKYFKEHGHVIGLMSVLPKTAYQQNINKAWQRTSKEDYYFPEFAHLGEQAVSNYEVFWDGTEDYTVGEETFGYQSRYAEYKYQCDSVHGDFRDQLDFWHMGRKFAARPNLNSSFVESDPTKRIYAVTDPDIDDLYIQVYNSVKAKRPMPYYGTPRL